MTPWPPRGVAVGRRVVGEVAGTRPVGVHQVDLTVPLVFEDDLRAVRRPRGLKKGPFRGREPRDARADRKSTRLNSSHTVISYAVFCLKKKKRAKKTAAFD